MMLATVAATIYYLFENIPQVIVSQEKTLSFEIGSGKMLIGIYFI